MNIINYVNNIHKKIKYIILFFICINIVYIVQIIGIYLER